MPAYNPRGGSRRSANSNQSTQVSPRSSGGASYFSKRPVRRSSLVSPWGIGAMVDFPGDESLMTAGLDAWPLATGQCPTDWNITEERLQKRLGVDHFRLPPDFRKPGNGIENVLQRIPFVRFPQWHVCTKCGQMKKLSLFSQGERCSAPGWCQNLPEKKRSRVVPMRFIAVCSTKGHIQDFPFMEWVHRTSAPNAECRLKLRGGLGGAGLSGIKISCSCGQSRAMTGAFNEGALDNIAGCLGQRPWLGEWLEGPESDKPQACGCRLRTVQRGASNTYFPHIASSIYLPLWGEAATESTVKALEDPAIWKGLTDALEDGKIPMSECRSVAKYKPHLNLDPEDLRAAAQRRLDEQNGLQSAVSNSGSRSGRQTDRFAEEENFRHDEYVAMCLGKTVQPELEMRRFEGSEYDEPISGFFRTISLVRKLRETRALYGFSRGLPDDGRSPEEQMMELRLDSTIDWLPAVVTRGEGIFFQLDDNAVGHWLSRRGTEERAGEVIDAMRRARAQRGQPERKLSPEFVLLHTLAHLLINQLAFDCGYGSSSLRERIYCHGAFPDKPMRGFLIYTASGDSEGTMGGLVRQGEKGRIEKILARALNKALWCSYDPVCLESAGQGPDNCNRAACHGCAIVPETSCEEGNRLLDRVTVVGTPENPELGFFSSFLRK